MTSRTAGLPSDDRPPAGHIPVVGLLTENDQLRQAVVEALSPVVAVLSLTPLTFTAGRPPESLPVIVVDAALLAEGGGLAGRWQGAKPLVLAIVDQAHLSGDGWLNGPVRDFVVWPCLPAELHLRVKKLLAQARWAGGRRVICGSLVIDLDRFEVTAGGRPIHLTTKEFLLLRELALRQGCPVARKELLDAVWGWRYHPGSNVVDVVVRSLRKKLEPAPSRPQYILTVRGVGYRLAETAEDGRTAG